MCRLEELHQGPLAQPAVPSLRGLFVRYPGRRDTPPLARCCERWVSLEPRATPELAVTLGRLVG